MSDETATPSDETATPLVSESMKARFIALAKEINDRATVDDPDRKLLGDETTAAISLGYTLPVARALVALEADVDLQRQQLARQTRRLEELFEKQEVTAQNVIEAMKLLADFGEKLTEAKKVIIKHDVRVHQLEQSAPPAKEHGEEEAPSRFGKLTMDDVARLCQIAKDMR